VGGCPGGQRGSEHKDGPFQPSGNQASVAGGQHRQSSCTKPQAPKGVAGGVHGWRRGAEAHWQSFKLDVKGEGEHIGPAGDKMWGDTQWLEGWGASTGPQPVAQRSAGDTGAQSKSCRDELGAPEVGGTNKEVSVKHPKGNKGCSSVKVTWPAAQMKCLYANACSMGNKQKEWKPLCC